MPISRRGRRCRSPGTRIGRTRPTIWPSCSKSSSSCTATAAFGDDRAIRTGFARLDRHKVLVVGHQKGRTYKERSACYFGCAHPEGYRKAMLKMKLAEKYGLPVICLIDTPGAYPGIGAEERGQSQAIAENMYEMSRLKTPIICIVIGEGGSGGALGIGVGDRVAMLEFSYYSVISPEGCAGILWKSHQYAERAANALKFTSQDLLGCGVVDHVIPEPLGGAASRPPSNGHAGEAIPGSLAARAGRAADRQAARRPLREVPPDGRVSGRSRSAFEIERAGVLSAGSNPLPPLVATSDNVSYVRFRAGFR